MHYSDIRESIEDSNKFKSSLEASIPIFQKSPETRSEADHNQIFYALQKIPFFRRHFDLQLDKNLTLLQLSKVFQYEEYKKNSALYHHGSIPQKVFFILEGDVASYTMKTDDGEHSIPDGPLSFRKKYSEENERMNGREGKELLESVEFKAFNMDKKYFKDGVFCFRLRKVYQAGNFMGDISVVFNTPYEDTLVTWNDVKLVSLDKKDFKRIFQETLQETQEKCLFFRDIFPKVDQDILTGFGYAFDKKVLKSHDRVFQKGSNHTDLYIVTEGEIELFENFPVEEGKQEAGKIKNQKKTVKVSVLLVSKGQFFGEEALLEQKERVFTAVAKNLNTIVYSVPTSSLVKLATYYPEFLRYLTSQVRASFESKLKRLENLKLGMEKIAQNNSQVHQKSPIDPRSSFLLHRESFSSSTFPEKFDKLVHQNTGDLSPNPKVLEERLSSSPRMLKMPSKKLTESKIGFTQDQVRIDAKSPNGIEDIAKYSQTARLSQMGNSPIDNQKMYYYPDNLWEHEKKQHQAHCKKVRKDIVERNLAREVMASLNSDRSSRATRVEADGDAQESYCFQLNPLKVQERLQKATKKNKIDIEVEKYGSLTLSKFKKRVHSNMGLAEISKPEREHFSTEPDDTAFKTLRFFNGQLSGVFSSNGLEESSPIKINRLEPDSERSSARHHYMPLEKSASIGKTQAKPQQVRQNSESPKLKLSISGPNKSAKLAASEIQKTNLFINISSSLMIKNPSEPSQRTIVLGTEGSLKSPRKEEFKLPVIQTKALSSPRGIAIKKKILEKK